MYLVCILYTWTGSKAKSIADNYFHVVIVLLCFYLYNYHNIADVVRHKWVDFIPFCFYSTASGDDTFENENSDSA